MEERRSRLSSMAWKRLHQYSCGLLIPQNSMFSNFCHVLKYIVVNLNKEMNKGLWLWTITITSYLKRDVTETFGHTSLLR